MRIGVPLAAAAMIVGFAAPTAVAAAPSKAITHCGTVVTASYAYLPHNLSCSAGGVTVDAPGVILDLRGHRLSGPGSSADFTGVDLTENASGSRVTNGALTGWAAAVGAEFSITGVKLSRLQFRSDATAVRQSEGSELSIYASSFRHVTIGVRGLKSHVTIGRSIFSTGNTAVKMAADTRADVRYSTITGFDTGASCSDDWCTFTHTVFRNNGTAIDDGVRSHVDLTASLLAHNGTGLDVTSEATATVTHTRFLANGKGVQVNGFLAAATISNSYFARNCRGIVMPAVPTRDGFSGVDLRSNVFRANGDGVHLGDTGGESAIGGNRAFHNARWGIWAAGTVRDLGNNVAWHNGEPAQCYGVVCTAP